jgi:adenine-specific DNA-methyltransferase
MARKKSSSSPSVTSTKHNDKRKNIPTEELRDFVAEDETDPEVRLYPRDPSLDPQLVWKGKDEQDRQDLAVPVVPIYIQEKIHPQAIIEDVRAQTQKKAGEAEQLALFDDFNGLEFGELIEFYRHEQNWTNRMILGDSLLVMASLAEKEGLKGQVQMIYIDPPYGIKFGSNWQVSTRKRYVKDGKAEDATRQPEQIKAFRDTWQLGIHSYLAYLRDRLEVARELLSESGSIFVQIGDENIHLVRCLLDEVFGSENFLSQITFAKTSGLSSLFLYGICDYILWYGKSKDQTKYRQLHFIKVAGEAGATKYNRILLPNGEFRPALAGEKTGELDLPEGSRLWVDDNLTSQGNPLLEFFYEGKRYTGTYKTNLDGLRRLSYASRIYAAQSSIRYIRFFDDFLASPINSAWMDIGGIQSRVDPKIYVVQTATEAIKRCLLMTTDPGDLVLDPTCGGGTTAYVAEQWGRRWITVDTSRVAIALARTRLMAGRFRYYLLADSPEGIKQEAELNGQVPLTPLPATMNDIKRGFVCRRVPHITLKSIANNEEIDEIHARWQHELEPLRAEINQIAGSKWEEWEIPREVGQSLSGNAGLKERVSKWWELRRQRQAEIDAFIARRADYETLYDQPYEDKKRIRVTGPFTVESLSPHRFLSADEERPASEKFGLQAETDGFEAVMLDNLNKAGVQNTKENERLSFDRLEPYPGEWIQAEGEYTDQDGKTRRAAVSIGPEHGTVGPQLVKEAAKEAVRGIGFDLLIVCGFAFDPHVSEEAQRYGELTILPTRMNPDLAMGDTLLKKTGSGNLFMVFGEPDIEINTTDGKVQIEIKGLDIYDPTTGEIRSSSTDDIACWFIDTNYNEESFFVRHAYFTGADKPYENLKRALRAEIDEEAWEALYSMVSRPFDVPETGKIAVKVINHYGDEVLKVYEVSSNSDND